jgi:non-ribosomal peptide synthetase component F
MTRPAAPSCIHTAFEQRAHAEPERALLVDGDGFITQGQLLDAIHRRGQRLLASSKGPDRLVAVALEPSIETVISYFACLAAGLRYLPLPPGPPQVVTRLLRSLSPRVLVAHSEVRAACGLDIETLSVDSAGPRRFDSKDARPAERVIALPAPNPKRIAHVLLTSGTETETPKAVLTNHVGSLLSHAWRSRLWPYDPNRDVVGCNLFGIWDVVPALCHGIPVVMLDDATMRDPAALGAAIIRYAVTRLMLTPTLLDACLAFEDGIDALRRLQRIVLCGEPVAAVLMARAWEALPGVSIANLYSLSECHDVAGGELRPGERITSGRVADFAEVHITAPEDRGRASPRGRAGRVIIGGAALAAGYLDPNLTHERFFERRLRPGSRCGVGTIAAISVCCTRTASSRFSAASTTRERCAAAGRNRPRSRPCSGNTAMSRAPWSLQGRAAAVKLSFRPSWSRATGNRAGSKPPCASGSVSAFPPRVCRRISRSSRICRCRPQAK